VNDRQIDWLEQNQAALQAGLERLKRLLRNAADQQGQTPPPRAPGEGSTLGHLAAAFGLSGFECDVVLLCAGMELDSEIAELCAAAQDEPQRQFPSFALALSVLPDAHWSALSPEAALRAWRLVEVDPGPQLTRARLRIDERVLHFLTGLRQFDERLAALVEKLPSVPPEELPPSLDAIAERLAATWANGPRGREATLVQLCGSAANCRAVAAAAAALLGLEAASLPAARLPAGAGELDALLRLWEREAVLSGHGLLLVDCDDDAPDAEAHHPHQRDAALARLAERLGGPLILRERTPRRIATRSALVLDVPSPSPAEQLALWQAALGEAAPEQAELAALAAQFSLGPSAIRAAAAEWRGRGGEDLWMLCRQRLRGALDGLAERIESAQSWDDLVLPDAQKSTLRAIAAQLRQRGRVYEEWGFAAKSRRGLGLSALFHGPSGTGKTMAAEILANELKLDLYHIDLSRIVSKYIGETEKNLRRVFDAADANGAILLFDEADSLFGKRSEVKDSHDRYANIEVSYLLQRMEAYRGLAILTTNMRAAIDPAFLRRIRFTVSFPFPDVAERARIWQRVFPAATPVDGLDPERLAQLRLAGGNIRNIALNAAFIAADAGDKVGMAHIRAAARAEYDKLERRPAQSEEAAWA
jgi:AAA+ superfamily predicted ATPase